MAHQFHFILCENDASVPLFVCFFCTYSTNMQLFEILVVNNWKEIGKREEKERKKKTKNVAKLMRSKSPDQIVHGCGNGLVLPTFVTS